MTINVSKLDDANGLDLAKTLAAGIAECLPKELHAASFTLKSKLPFKAASLREALIHRVSELSSVAIELYERKRLVPAFILIRSVVETMAMIYWLHKKVSEFLKAPNVENLDDFLMRAMLGGRDGIAKLEAYNVLTAVDQVEKNFPGIRKMYDTLCEFTHPNWLGALGAYGKINADEVSLELGADLRTPPPALGLAPLVGALAIFNDYYNALADELEKLNSYFEKTNETPT